VNNYKQVKIITQKMQIIGRVSKSILSYVRGEKPEVELLFHGGSRALPRVQLSLWFQAQEEQT